jgi:hypothetical protein
MDIYNQVAGNVVNHVRVGPGGGRQAIIAGGTYRFESASDVHEGLWQAGGTVIYDSTGTLGGSSPQDDTTILGGHFDAATGQKLKTISDLSVFPGATADIPSEYVTVTTGGRLLERGEMG